MSKNSASIQLSQLYLTTMFKCWWTIVATQVDYQYGLQSVYESNQVFDLIAGASSKIECSAAGRSSHSLNWEPRKIVPLITDKTFWVQIVVLFKDWGVIHVQFHFSDRIVLINWSGYFFRFSEVKPILHFNQRQVWLNREWLKRNWNYSELLFHL